MNIVLRSQEDTNSALDLLVAGDTDEIVEWFVIETWLTHLDDRRLSILRGSYGNAVADDRVKVFEVSDEIVDGNGVNFDSGEGKLLMSPFWKMFLVLNNV